MDLHTLLVTTVVGGVTAIVTGVITWWITRSRERLDETRRLQRELLTQFISNRHDLVGEPFTQALNGCAVVFAESPAVQERLLDFHQKVTSSRRDQHEIELALVRLIRSMIEHLDLRLEGLQDEFLLKPFNTRAGSALPKRLGDS